MNPQIRYVVIGGFLVAGAIALVAGALWLGESGAPRAPEPYRMVFGQNVTGLNVGSPVRYLGVDVGRVTAIGLSDGDRPSVEVRADIAESAPVTPSTTATLSYEGITGVAYVSLSDDASREPRPLKTVDGVTEIPTRPGAIGAVLDAAPELMGRLNEILGRVERIVSDDNLAAIDATVHDVQALAEALAAQREELADAFASLTGAANRAQAISGRIDAFVAGLEPRVDAVAADIAAAVAEAREIAARVSEWLAADDGAARRTLAATQAELSELMEAFAEAAEEVADLARRLERNPSAILYQPTEQGVVAEP